MKTRYERTTSIQERAHVRLTIDDKEKYRLKLKKWRKIVDQFEEAIAKEESAPLNIRHLVWKASGGLVEQYQQLDWLIDEWNKMDTEYRERLRKDAKTSLAAFAEYINPDEPPAHHHEWLCKELEAVERGETMQLLISMPPGSAKSTYGSHLFPAWYMGRHPNNKYIQ